MTSPKTRPRTTSPALVVVVFAPLLLSLLQVVSGHPFSPVWSVLAWMGTAISLVYGLVIPWFAARPLRKLRAVVVATSKDGVAQIVAIRSSEELFSRLVVLHVNSSKIATFESETESVTINWSMIDKISQIPFGHSGQLSVIVFGLGGEKLLDFIPMGKLGIHQLSPLRFHEYVRRISVLRQLR